MMRTKKRIFYAGIISLISGISLLCTSSRKQERVLPGQASLSENTPRFESNAPIVTMSDDAVPEIVGPEKWVNESFVLLSKPPMFRRFGYELFRCADTSTCADIDTLYELPNRRLRYDRFCNDTLIVTGATLEPDGEWLITFLDNKYSMKLFARTKKSSLQEMIFLSDFKAACARWVGKTVFSRKGTISVALAGGNLSSLKVKRYDSLKVFDVRYGLSPLPVNPIWLMVITSNGIEGFIPIRYSWTNAMADQIFDAPSWSDDISEINPMQQYNWDLAVWEVIESHRITIGMNKDQVHMSWGRPLNVVDTTFNSGKVQYWKYAAQKLYFNENGLISIEDQGSYR